MGLRELAMVEQCTLTPSTNGGVGSTFLTRVGSVSSGFVPRWQST